MQPLSKQRINQLKATAENLILDIHDANELFNGIAFLEAELKRKKERLDEYACGWDRQQMIINNLSQALIDQELITLNNLKDTFSFRGLRNSIQPDELDECIYKIKTGVK